MRNLNFKLITTAVLFLFVFISLPVYGETAADKVAQHLDKVERLINPEFNWSVKREQTSPGGQYRVGRPIRHREGILITTIPGSANFCGVRVLNSPMHLKLKLYSKGLSIVEAYVGDKKVDTFEIDGSSGTGLEMEKEIVITSKAAVRDYPLELRVTNKGFKPFRTESWPPRKTALNEENAYFAMREAEIVYPTAAQPHGKMKDWLLSMKIGHALLYPDFVRYTFIGKPFNIEDKRKTPKERLNKLKQQLEQAVHEITPSLLNSSRTAGLTAAIRESYKVSDPVREFAKEFRVHLIGNAHIDIAWLWRMAETVLVARNTYDTVMNNMEEYGELHYAQSQALTYQWMEKEYPVIFERIKEKIKTGQWEVVGGMWVEPDCNLISGESWVRQILYGKRYFKEKFGIDVDTGWNPDSFGYNWNMPQIYTKSGIKRFITQKIWWNDTTVFPHFIFWWQGVDDTRIMTYFPPVGYTARVRMPGDMINIIRYEATTGYKKTLLLYGLGDHGGGPNREILNRVRSYGNLHIAPEFVHSKAIDFLKPMETEMKENIPVWKDELYLEYHRGTFTTQADTKKNNRQGESLLNIAEKLATAAFLQGAPYPAEKLEAAWKIVLTNQFHDILPGSSITPVYRDAAVDYAQAIQTANGVMMDSFQRLAKKVDSSRVKGKALVVYNPLSWKRTDLLTVFLPQCQAGTVKILDPAGKEVPVESSTPCESGGALVRFIARDVPPLGYMVFSVVKSSPVKHNQSAAVVSGDSITVENVFFKIKINKKSGNIASLWDKRLNREWVAEGKEANVLQVYEDRPENWDAWNIGYTGRMWELNDAESVKIVEETPVRTVIRVKKNFLGLSKHRYSPTEEFPSSFFTQDIIVYKNLDRIDIETTADWWEDHMMLKAAFPVNVRADFATYEIPFASIQRTTKSETLWEKARFEVPALRWADLSEKDFGISLLNNCKYGHDIHDNVIKLSLLRAPIWPDPMADRGKHTFTYSLYPHTGGAAAAETVKRARELNIPLLAMLKTPQKGEMPEKMSFFKVDSPSVILDSTKKAEDDNGIILRLFESGGTAAKAEITFFKGAKKIYETDLMENIIKEYPAAGKSIRLDFKKFEIKTLKIIF